MCQPDARLGFYQPSMSWPHHQPQNTKPTPTIAPKNDGSALAAHRAYAEPNIAHTAKTINKRDHLTFLEAPASRGPMTRIPEAYAEVIDTPWLLTSAGTRPFGAPDARNPG